MHPLHLIDTHSIHGSRVMQHIMRLGNLSNVELNKAHLTHSARHRNKLLFLDQPTSTRSTGIVMLSRRISRNDPNIDFDLANQQYGTVSIKRTGYVCQRNRNLLMDFSHAESHYVQNGGVACFLLFSLAYTE